jgi:hypothetical protein
MQSESKFVIWVECRIAHSKLLRGACSVLVLVAVACGGSNIEQSSAATPPSPTATTPTSSDNRQSDADPSDRLAGPASTSPTLTAGAPAQPSQAVNSGAAGSAPTASVANAPATRTNGASSTPPAPSEAAPMAADSGSAAPTPPAASSGSAEWGTDCEQRPIFKAHDGALADGRQHTVAAGAQGVITYFFKAPWTGDVQLLKSRAVLDNRKVVHHWAMWAVDSTAAKDGEVRGAMGETVEALGGEQFVAGGGPGATDVELPPNVGMRMATGSNLLIELEIHYYNAGEADEADASSVELCLTSKKRPVEAAVHSLGRASFEMPPDRAHRSRAHRRCHPAHASDRCARDGSLEPAVG